ncbi:MAG TPA: hypothetical protein VH560_03585, partial [Polyangia bacterium]|nr:hypothetical protein [Polyangia bacterium]
MPDLSLQLQADNLPQDSLEKILVEGHWAPVLGRLLTGENLLLEGCRGEGKTMLMRAAAGRLAKSASAGGTVLGIHATFKRYLTTIPPAGATGEAELGNFKAWVNSRILGAVKLQLEETFGPERTRDAGVIGRVDWQKLIGLLETTYRGVPA